jgi:exopolysaccharide biosynthesis polyprenyl glycosylphosphotransferase
MFAAIGICAAWWLRYQTRLDSVGMLVPQAKFADYMPLILVGVGLLVGTFAQLGLYDERLLLRRFQSLAIILKGAAFWLVAYLSITLVLKFNPPISRLFVVVAFASVVLLSFLWRSVFYAVISRGPMIERIQLRVAVLGWNDDAQRLVAEISAHRAHPYKVVGLIAEDRTLRAGPGEDLPVPVLGQLTELESALRAHCIDVLILADLQFPLEMMRRITDTCERTYAALKIVPSVFDVFISGLRMQTIGNVPVLGVEDLAITKLFNRIGKRAFDISAGVLGLVLSAPLIALGALLVKIESPGPAFFGQRRVGVGHRCFQMWKLRSMRLDAPANDKLSVSTATNDPRLLKVGRFLRRWNIDELPQFWNVLIGDMSLVGPRPERPFHVERLSAEIAHYLPRHIVRPGMTGWAQVNGLRGGTDVAKRIQYDICYIENWSMWLDAQIALLTVFRWRNPAG